MDKILTENFDKMKAIEESDDPFCVGAKADTPINEYTEIGEDDRSDNLGRLEHHTENLRDAIQEFEELRTELLEFRERLGDAIRGYSPEDYQRWKAYGLSQLGVIAGDEDVLAADENIGTLIEKLTDEYQETKREMGSA